MEREVIFVATLTMVILVIIIIILFITFQTKKNKYILEKMEAQKRFDEEITKSQMEIREQALKNIAWELHDNVGQLLSTAKMQLNILQTKLIGDCNADTSEISSLIGDSLQEIRLLSKTLNPEVIHNMGLRRSIEIELERFNKLNFLNAELTVKGEEVLLEQKDEIIIFRILQEFFSNVIKHSKASKLNVVLKFAQEKLSIMAEDNGVGFDPGAITVGSGLINMQSRAELIGASYSIQSKNRKGVSLSMEYKLKKQ